MFYITRVLPELIRRLTVPVTVSEHSKLDIVKYAHVPEARIRVIHNGFESHDFVPTSAPKTNRYWLYVSRIEHPGKNHVGLIEAYDNLSCTHRDLPVLMLAGGDWDGAAAVHERRESSPNRDKILFLGFVPDGTLPALVAGADAVIYPSLYEGFGIPILEAMACGVPVACSNTSSLPEVGGDAAIYFDPTRIEDIVGAMRRLLTDPVLRSELSAKGLVRARQFTWEKCAEETITILRSAANHQ
jgi:glycosyltransferase involved in cell wall biosynthesis